MIQDNIIHEPLLFEVCFDGAILSNSTKFNILFQKRLQFQFVRLSPSSIGVLKSIFVKFCYFFYMEKNIFVIESFNTTSNINFFKNRIKSFVCRLLLFKFIFDGLQALILTLSKQQNFVQYNRYFQFSVSLSTPRCIVFLFFLINTGFQKKLICCQGTTILCEIEKGYSDK